MRKPNWIERCAWIGEKLANQLRRAGYVTAVRADPKGRYGALSPPHLLYMAEVLANRDFEGDEAKACRWLGWLQAGMVNLGMCTLEEMMQLNTQSGKLVMDAVSAVDSPAPAGHTGDSK